MTELLGVALRAAQTACVAACLGIALLALLGPSASAQFPARTRRVQLLLLLFAIVLGVAGLAVQVATVVPEVKGREFAETAARLLARSRFGVVWSLRESLLIAALLAAALPCRSGARAPALAILLAGNLAVLPVAGHSAALEPAIPSLVAHGLHAVAAAAWLGALAPLYVRLRRDRGDPAVRILFARFSRLAMALMVCVVVTGLWLAVQHTERWPALLGTPYGAVLAAKVGVLVAVLAFAARLRFRLLPMWLAGASVQGTLVRWLAAEAALAFGVLVLAATLGQTIPARHDAIRWWLPFRVSADATWDLPFVSAEVSAGALAAVAGAAFGLRQVRRVGSPRAGIAFAAVLVAGGAAVVVHALSVPAYPDTYRTPSVPYQTISVARGAGHYRELCSSCHGAGGHGDGVLARGLAVAPADLTEPHTSLHTAGDIFWWLTHGKPPGPMPSFADRTTEDDRWDLINYVRTLSSGYQARILTERIVPLRPWLGAIDFGYTTAGGRTGSLQDFRERSAVLLVFFRRPGSDARLAQIGSGLDALRDAGAEVLVIPVPASEPSGSESVPVVTDGGEETALAYSLWRRTLGDADARDQAPVPDHMELLVDRFGYVRARWLPRDGAGWSDMGALLAQIRALANEPRVRPPPDDHVH